MRYDFGNVYKEIRESKGLTQEEVCGNVLSRTSLSKIESGKATPKYENMEFLLRQINMSFEEFDYICHLYQPSHRIDYNTFWKRNTRESHIDSLNLKNILTLILRTRNCNILPHLFDFFSISNFISHCFIRVKMVTVFVKLIPITIVST